MKKAILLVSAAAFLGACNAEAIQQQMRENSKPFVVAVNEASVTVAAEGNYLSQSRPTSDPRTVPLAEQTCKSVGKRGAVYQSSVDSREHYYRRNHMFLCIN
jgi:hypothetical protein